MAGVRGDFYKLRGLIANMAKLGEGDFRDLTKVLAAEAVTQVQLGFEQSRDPYGRPWRPVTRRGKPGRPLRDTGRLMASYTGRGTRKGFIVATNVKYAAPHQYGTKRLHQRMMVPEQHRGYGRIWRSALGEAARTWMRQRVRTRS